MWEKGQEELVHAPLENLMRGSMLTYCILDEIEPSGDSDINRELIS